MESWDDLRSTINDHLSQLHISPPLIQRFPKINEGPISSSQRFLSNANLSIAYSRYEQDYNVLKLKHPPAEDHQQTQPSPEELKRINNFVSSASRSIYLFNKGKELIREISEKNKEELKIIQDENNLRSNELDENYKKSESLLRTISLQKSKKQGKTQQEIHEIKTKHSEIILNIHEQHRAKINSIKEQHTENIASLQAEHKKTYDSLHNEHELVQKNNEGMVLRTQEKHKIEIDSQKNNTLKT